MLRGKRTILDDLVELPWWYSALAALIAFVFVGCLLPLALPRDHRIFAAISSGLPTLATVIALVFLLPMPFAYLNGRRKRRLVDVSADLDSIRALSWREFEKLVAEAYRRMGYTVRENPGASADGGVDVALEKGGQLHLVQCKQWKARKVGVQVVREMYGVMVDRGASSMRIVSAGMFTQEAANFAENKPIDLIDGPQLAALLTNVQATKGEPTASSQDQVSPGRLLCPECGRELVARTARRGRNVGKQFMGCSGFPKCRYTRNA